MRRSLSGTPTFAAPVVAILVLGAAITLRPRGGASQGVPPTAPQTAGAGVAIGAAPPPAAVPPLPQGPAPDLDLVFSAQVIGWIEPCG